jgi:hypothetical protein
MHRHPPQGAGPSWCNYFLVVTIPYPEQFDKLELGLNPTGGPSSHDGMRKIDVAAIEAAWRG